MAGQFPDPTRSSYLARHPRVASWPSFEGVIQAGTCLAMKPLPPKYTRGSCTSWAAANGVIYSGGKSTHVFVRNGKWRGGDRRHVEQRAAA